MKKFEIENRYFLRTLPQDLESYRKVHITHYYLNPFFDADVLAIIRGSGIDFKNGATFKDLQTLVKTTPNKGFRVTKYGNEFCCAFKGRSDKTYPGKKRIEIESAEASSGLIGKLIFQKFTREAKRISKTRYFVPLDQKLTAEIDLFDAPFENLRLVEVEFHSEKAGLTFEPPDFFGAPATKISNRKLAQLTTPV